MASSNFENTAFQKLLSNTETSKTSDINEPHTCLRSACYRNRKLFWEVCRCPRPWPHKTDAHKTNVTDAKSIYGNLRIDKKKRTRNHSFF